MLQPAMLFAIDDSGFGYTDNWCPVREAPHCDPWVAVLPKSLQRPEENSS